MIFPEDGKQVPIGSAGVLKAYGYAECEATGGLFSNDGSVFSVDCMLLVEWEGRKLLKRRVFVMEDMKRVAAQLQSVPNLPMDALGIVRAAIRCALIRGLAVRGILCGLEKENVAEAMNLVGPWPEKRTVREVLRS